MKANLLILICLLSVGAITADAQMNRYKWNALMCSFDGTYDSRKYSADQIRDAVRLAATNEFDLIAVDTTVFKFEDIDKLSVAALETEYMTIRRSLAGLKVIDDPYWQKLWRDKINEADRVYQLSRATILGYKTPERLRDFTLAPHCSRDYAEPLIAGGESLLDAWLKVDLASRQRNSDPERIRKIYETQLASPDRMKFAQVEVMAFGWWNCANAVVRLDQDYTEQSRRLKKLFKKVKEDCEEP